MLQLSMRRMHDLVAFCLPYEFEDVVADVTGADRVEPENYRALEFARRAYKLLRLTTRSRRLARALAPRPGALRLTRDYELFFPAFNNAFELFSLFSVPDWRQRCRVAACFISEIWANDVPEYLLELLAGFDHLFLGVRHPTQEVARIVGRPCTYLPLAVDVLRFAPQPHAPPRAIDVCNIGRRSPVTHEALLRLARERRIFYYYDTVRASGESGKQMTFRVNNASEHRLLLASLLQRSRYYLANRARVNEPEIIEGREEISRRRSAKDRAHQARERAPRGPAPRLGLPAAYGVRHSGLAADRSDARARGAAARARRRCLSRTRRRRLTAPGPSHLKCAAEPTKRELELTPAAFGMCQFQCSVVRSGL